MQDELLIGTVGTSISAVGTATQSNEKLQKISLIITVIGALITYIIIPLLTWYKNAKKDGKVTKEELAEGGKIIADGSQKVKEEVDKTKGGE